MLFLALVALCKRTNARRKRFGEKCGIAPPTESVARAGVRARALVPVLQVFPKSQQRARGGFVPHDSRSLSGAITAACACPLPAWSPELRRQLSLMGKMKFYFIFI